MTTLTPNPKPLSNPAPVWLRSPVIVLAGGLLLALISALAVFIPALNPPGGDVRLLILFLSVSGTLSIVGAYALCRFGLLHWLSSLRWTLLVTICVTVLLVFLNVFVTAQLMFISDHDFWLTTALLVFAGLTALAFGLFAANAITERISALARGAEQLAGGDLAAQVSVRGNDELAELAQTFNWMARSLAEAAERQQALEQSRRDLIAWVSHDLRTPLASMRAMVEAIQDGVADDPETEARYLTTVQGEITHLSHLIDDLFDLSRLDVGHLALACEWSSLHDLLSDTAGALHGQAVQRQVALQANVAPDIDPVYMASDKIQRVLTNLLDNAIGHTPAGGTVTLTARRSGDTVQVAVHNTGSVIAPDDLAHVFERFYRGRETQARAPEQRRGTGLGLAIARGFVEAHGGTIHAASTPDVGTTFTFTLPVSGPPGV